MALRNPTSFANAALTGTTTAAAITAAGAIAADSLAAVTSVTGATLKTTGTEIRTSYQIETPTTGATVTTGSTKTDLKLFPAGTIATLTIALPSSPVDGQILRISSSQIITAITFTGGNIFPAPPSGIVAGGSYELQYWTGGVTWLNGF